MKYRNIKVTLEREAAMGHPQKDLISSNDSNYETSVPMPPNFAKHVSQILKIIFAE